MGLRQTWIDYRSVKRELSPRKLIPTVVRDVRAGRLTVREVVWGTIAVWLDLGDGASTRPRGRGPDDTMRP